MASIPPLQQKVAGIGMTSARTRARMVERLREEGIRDEAVLAAMNEVPRHIFVDEALAHRAYEDTALPIGHGQTISQPYIVARMTELLRAGGALERVLEVGVGCGYQTAVLSHVAKEVYGIERIAALVSRARQNLATLRIRNVRIKHGDGQAGLPSLPPFDAILIAAATSHVPQDLLSQLAVGGRMVLPRVRGAADEQRLCVIQRTEEEFQETWLEAVRFVPLLGGTA